MKIGLCCWNRWGDDIVDRPDNSDEPIIANMVHHLSSRDYDKIYGLQILDDPSPVFHESSADRAWAFDTLEHTHGLPELDVLFLRWRWNIPGRERLVARQQEVLERYLSTATRVIVWDDDFQLLRNIDAAPILTELSQHQNVEYIEISDAAKSMSALADRPFTAVPYQLDIDIDAARRAVRTPSRYARLGYVGNRYDRDDIIDRWLAPEAAAHPSLTHLYGNWSKTDSVTRWPNITFHPKVDRIGRDEVCRDSIAVPMLAKQVYLDLGHVVPRLHETVHAGGIPIGLASFRNANSYFRLVAQDGMHLSELIDEAFTWSLVERQKIVAEQCELMASEFNTELFMEKLKL